MAAAKPPDEVFKALRVVMHRDKFIFCLPTELHGVTCNETAI